MSKNYGKSIYEISLTLFSYSLFYILGTSGMLEESSKFPESSPSYFFLSLNLCNCLVGAFGVLKFYIIGVVGLAFEEIGLL